MDEPAVNQPDQLPTTPEQTPSPQAPKSNKVMLIVLSAIIVILLAVLAGGGIYLATRDKDDANSNNTNTSQNNNNQDEEDTSNTDTKPLATSKMTKSSAYQLELTAIEKTGNNVRVKMDIHCTSPKGCSPSNLDFESGPGQYGLGGSYIVDENADQKYETVKDEKDKVLATSSLNDTLAEGAKRPIYVIITAPPKNVPLSIYIPGAEPFGGVVYK